MSTYDPAQVRVTFGGVELRGVVSRPARPVVELVRAADLDCQGEVAITAHQPLTGWFARLIYGLKPRSRWRAIVRARRMVAD